MQSRVTTKSDTRPCIFGQTWTNLNSHRELERRIVDAASEEQGNSDASQDAIIHVSEEILNSEEIKKERNSVKEV